MANLGSHGLIDILWPILRFFFVDAPAGEDIDAIETRWNGIDFVDQTHHRRTALANAIPFTINKKNRRWPGVGHFDSSTSQELEEKPKPKGRTALFFFFGS